MQEWRHFSGNFDFFHPEKWSLLEAIVLTTIAMLSEEPNYKLFSANFQLEDHVFVLGTSSMYIHSVILGMSSG